MDFEITDAEFLDFQGLVHRIAGISLPSTRKLLVRARLSSRLKACGASSFTEYFALLSDGRHAEELQTAVDLLTTNETHFFREPKHFEFLRAQARAHRREAGPFRVWSAACSSGEEPYSIAMVLADELGAKGAWEVIASDVCTRVLERARGGHYVLERARSIPPDYLSRFCLKGKGEQTGTFLVDRPLRDQVQLCQINLNERLPAVGEFDLIFLRNVMIYFDADTRRQVVTRLLPQLKRAGHLLVGHTETLHGVNAGLSMVRPSIYRRAA